MHTFKVNGQSVPRANRVETNERTDGDCITSHANAVGKMGWFEDRRDTTAKNNEEIGLLRITQLESRLLEMLYHFEFLFNNRSTQYTSVD